MPSCYEKAVQLLARRPHFRAELASKLEVRGYPPDEVAEAVARLAQRGYLDDIATARSFVRERLARGGGEGRSRLEAELARRGAAPAAIEEALAELPADELPAARRAAEIWLARSSGRKTGLATPEASARSAGPLARHLARKGFSPRAIFSVLREATAPDRGSGRGEEADDEEASFGAPASDET